MSRYGFVTFGVCANLLVGVCVASLNAEDTLRSPERVDHLRSRLLVLESGGIPVEAAASVKVVDADASEEVEAPAPLPTGWRKSGAWDRVATDFTKEQVVEILGKPERVLASIDSGVDLVYHYEQRIHAAWVSQLRGHVNFKAGKVVSIQRPDFK